MRLKKLTTLFVSVILFYNTSLSQPGNVDVTFCASGIEFDNFVNVAHVQKDNKVVVGGKYKKVDNNSNHKYLVRLTSDGTIETGYIKGTGFDGEVTCIGEQSDGKLIIGGSFSTYNGDSSYRIIRLNTDGSKDATFNTGRGFNSAPYVIVVQADGKIMVGGHFTSFNGASTDYLVRLNSNGSKDNSFTTGKGFFWVGSAPAVGAITIQSDGKYLISGNFTSFDNNTAYRLVRLNTNGSYDNTFKFSGLDKAANHMVIQKDGKIVIGGDFNKIGSKTVYKIARLWPAGQLDTTGFMVGSGFDESVFCLAVQSDDKLYAGGFFSSFNGVSNNSLIRLNANGSLDNTFTTPGNNKFSGPINSLAFQSDGKLIAGGGTYFGGSKSWWELTRIFTSGSADISQISLNPISLKSVGIGEYILSENAKVKTWKVYDASGRECATDDGLNINSVKINNLPDGVYYLKIHTESGIIGYKIMK